MGLLDSLCVAHRPDGWPAVYRAADYAAFKHARLMWQPPRQGQSHYAAKRACAVWIATAKASTGPRRERLLHAAGGGGDCGLREGG